LFVSYTESVEVCSHIFEETEATEVNAEDLLPFVPFVGFPYAAREAMKDDRTMKDSIQSGLEIGVSSGIGSIVMMELFGPERILGPGQVKLMRAFATAGPSVAAAALAVGAVVGASVIYEQKVSQPIRKGQSGIYFGPYASGFGSVV
jgi:hypothetical protein